MTTQRIRRVAVLLAAVLAMAVAASPASAGLITETSADSRTATGGSVLDSGVSSASATSIGGLSQANSSASAFGGSLGAFGQGGAIVYRDEEGGILLNGASGSAYARFVLDDVVFTTPDEAQSRISTFLNLSFSGGLVVSGGASETKYGHSGVSSHASASISGAIAHPTRGGLVSFNGTKNLELIVDTSQDLFYSTERESGMLTGVDLSSFDGRHDLETESFDVFFGVPLTFILSLTVQGNTSMAGSDAVGSGVADFGSTLTLPTSGPVFDLPPGYTVNSAQGQIVNNRWVGGAASSPVPEPSSFCIFGFGCLALLRYGWRRDCRKGIRKAPA